MLFAQTLRGFSIIRMDSPIKHALLAQISHKMKHIILLWFFYAGAGIALAQKPIKIILKNDTSHSLIAAGQYIHLTKNIATLAEKGNSADVIRLNAKQGGKFSYNPIAWDLAGASFYLLSLSSSDDGIWTIPGLYGLPLDSSELAKSNFGMLGDYLERWGGRDNPLFGLMMFRYASVTADIDRPLYFDITKPDSQHLKLFIYLKPKRELQVWSFDISQDLSKLRDTIMEEEFRRYWKNEANYPLSLDGHFSALTCKGKTYIATQDGAVYRLGASAEVIKQLPGQLDSGTLIVNKDTDEVHFLPATAFRQDRSLTESVRLEGAKILPE